MADQPQTRVPNILLPTLPELAVQIITWPLSFPYLITSLNVGMTVSAVAGVGAAYYLYGSPFEASSLDLLKGYLVAGTVQTLGLQVGTVTNQYM